jgi:Regulator of chromosome condensation (RCC1) repeat
MASLSKIAALVLALSSAASCAKTSHTESTTLGGAGHGAEAGGAGGPPAGRGGGGGSDQPVAGAAGSEAGPPSNLGTVQDATALWAGGATYACWLRSSGELRCTSRSPADEFMGRPCLLDGCEPVREPLIDLGTDAAVDQVVIGSAHACALLSAGRVKCWGAGGQLGLGDMAARRLPAEMGNALPFLDFGTDQPVVELAAGVNALHTCARFADGSVRCWGGNPVGELGLGDTQARGDEPNEMGAALPRVELGTGEKAVALAAGASSSCALLASGKVKCWGSNLSGQLGQGDTLPRGAAAGEMGDALSAVELGSGRSVTAIAAGNSHYCVLLDDGASKCWGEGGVLGLGDRDNRGDAPNEMGDALPALDLGSDWTTARLVGGSDHTCAVSSATTLKCWGMNNGGRLGLGDDGSGDKARLGDQANEMGDALPTVPLGNRRLADIALGSTFTCALLDDDSLACWGAWQVLPNVP